MKLRLSLVRASQAISCCRRRGGDGGLVMGHPGLGPGPIAFAGATRKRSDRDYSG